MSIIRKLTTMPSIITMFAAIGIISSASAQVITYPAPPGISTSPDFIITANGTAVWVVQSGQGGLGSLNLANFAATGSVTIKVTASGNISSYIIRPKSRNITASVSGRELTFTISAPQKLYLEIDNLPHLAILVDPPEVNPPSPGDANVTYYAAGAHAGGIALQSNHTYYVAPGAVVSGGITGNNVQNAKVIGRGFVIGNTVINNSSNIEFNGINVQSSSDWTITWNSVNHSQIRNIKLFSYCSPWGCDGLDINHCQYVTVDDCFIRAMDDCIPIKSFPAGNQNTDSITVINCVAVGWASSDGTTLGFELETDSVKNVLVKNCDFLYARGNGTSGGHSGFSITCDGPAWVTGIRFENIRCEEHVETRGMEFVVTNGTQWGSSPPGAIGHIKGIYIKDCSWTNTNAPLLLTGYDNTHVVEDITFDHCTYGGKLLTKVADGNFQINPYVKNVKFITEPPVYTAVKSDPAAFTTKPGKTIQFTATAVDQYGNSLATQPALFTWSVIGAGQISASGLYTAPSSEEVVDTIAVSATLSGTTHTGKSVILVSNRPGLSKIRYFPRSGFTQRMVGGVFEGTNEDKDSGPYETIATITSTPPEAWNEITVFTALNPFYRYVRYRGPDNSNCNVAEIEFYIGSIKAAGVLFGTPGSWNNEGLDYTKAFDGNTSTAFDYSTVSGGYTGMDVLGGSTALIPIGVGRQGPLVKLEASSRAITVLAAVRYVVSIHDLSGRKIREFDGDRNQTYVLSRADISDGIYLVTVTAGGRSAGNGVIRYMQQGLNSDTGLRTMDFAEGFGTAISRHTN